MDVKIRRVYEDPQKEDGNRILIDRLWPRGIAKEKAAIDLWLKEIAPSGELRKWFGHDPKKWTEFKKRYFEELEKNTAVAELQSYLKKGHITLVYSAKDREHNNAIVLKEYLERE